MDTEQYRSCAKELVDYVIDYLDNLRDRPVLPNVKPGYLRDLMPSEPPEHPEPWQDVLRDIEKVIMPGVTHCSSPYFHGYFPAANSYPSICAEILGSALTSIRFTWNSSPASTELEMMMMDWLGQMIKLPEQFLFRSGGPGGGVIQGSTSEATLVALLAARSRILDQISEVLGVGQGIEKLVVYASDQVHSSVEKAALLGAVRTHLLPSDDNLSLRGDILTEAIHKDRNRGYIPFFAVATLGTTSTCAFDNLKELGSVCAQENIWMHVDAAYAGASFICPEYRPLLDGIELAESFVFNPHKWLLVTFDCSAMWIRNRYYVTDAFSVSPPYLKHENEGEIPDYRHWEISLGRKFRSLKMWFVFRMYGVQGLRNYIRNHVHLAKYLEKLVTEDKRFEIVAPVVLGLVCFRIKGSNETNEFFLRNINSRRKIHLTPTMVRNQFILRMAICSNLTIQEDILYSWREIQSVASAMKL